MLTVEQVANQSGRTRIDFDRADAPSGLDSFLRVPDEDGADWKTAQNAIEQRVQICLLPNECPLEPRHADFPSRYAFHEFAQKYNLRDDFGTTATVAGHLNFPSYHFDAAFKVTLSAGKQLRLGLHVRPESPTCVHVWPKSTGKNRSVGQRQSSEQCLLNRRERFRQAILHVEEILLIVVESVPCFNQLIMVCACVLPFTEEDSGKVVLGFPFGEDPAGYTQRLASTA